MLPRRLRLGAATSGEAIVAMEELARKLPPGFQLLWTGMSLEEKEAGAGREGPEPGGR